MITELLVYGALMFMLGYWVARWIDAAPHELEPEESEIGGRIGSVPVPANVPAADELEGFAVAGKRRLPTWRERRRALELGARTQREKIEEWRD